MTRYRKSMSETLKEVDEIAKTIPEVAPPGWGHTVAKKEKTKPNKPKSKIGGSAHEFQKDLDSGKFKGLPGDKTKADKKASMFKLMWSMKNKGDKPHYKPGVKDKLKSQYKEEVELNEDIPTKKFVPLRHKVWSADASIPAGARPKNPGKIKKYKASGGLPETKLPPHLSKFLDKEGNPNPEAAKRIEAGRKKRAVAAKIKDVTPKGYGPKEEVEIDEWGNSILDRQTVKHLGRPGLAPKRKPNERGLSGPKRKPSDRGLGGPKKEEAEIDEAGPRGGGPLSRLRGEDPEKRRIRLTKQKERARKKYVASKGGDPRSVKMYTPAQQAAQQAKKADAQARYDDQMKGAPKKSNPGDQVRSDIKHRKENPQRKEGVELAIMSIDHKEAPRKLKITQKGLDALRTDRDRPKVKTQVKITKKGRDAIKDEVEMEGRFASPASDPRIGGSSSVDTVPDFTWKAKKGAISAPGSGSISKAKKAKASDVNKSIEQQMKDAMKESSDKWRENFKKKADERLAQRRREDQAAEAGQKAKPRQKDMGEIPEAHDCNEIHPDKTHSKWLKTQNEDTNRYWHSIKEAQWKVKLKGLPTFYVPGKSAGAIRQMLRKQLKRPMDDIEDVTRATPAAKKKDFRTRAQGKEDSAVVSGKS